MHKYKYNFINEVEYWSKPKQQEKDVSTPSTPQNMSIKRDFPQFLRKILIKFVLKGQFTSKYAICTIDCKK